MNLSIRLGKVTILLVLILFSLLLLTCCASTKDQLLDGLIDIGTHSLYIHCEGSGRPTIIIDTGLGETYEGWTLIVERIIHRTRVCVYDRAGYSQSEAGPMPRDAQRVADELHKLLELSGENGPFLLVGHSLGGLNLQVYAHTYPDEVSGLVLLDPSPLGWLTGEDFPELKDLYNEETRSIRAAAKEAGESVDPEAQAVVGKLETLASELEELFGLTADEVSEIKSFGDLPLIIIGATEPDPHFGEAGVAFRQFWNDENQVLADKSTSGSFLLVEGSSHQIQLDAPEFVIEIILGIIQ